MSISAFKPLKIALVALAALFFVLGSTIPGCMRDMEYAKMAAQRDAERHTFAEFEWPNSRYGQMLPKPESDIGRIEYEQDYGLSVRVAQTSQEQFDAYVHACQERGFTGEYYDGSDFYYALNDEGYPLTLSLTEEENVMDIKISEPHENPASSAAEASSSSASLEAAATEPEAQPASQTDSDFKAAMDSYEAFIDEYCAFMKKYNESSDPAFMMADYATMMTRYAEAMDKIAAIDEDALAANELAYYTEVMARTTQKMADIL